MATSIIGGGSPAPIPPTTERVSVPRLLADLDNDLETVSALLALTEWIESARYYVDTVQFHVEHGTQLQEIFRSFDFRWNSASWDSHENEGLAYLQIEIQTKILGAREQVAQARGIDDAGPATSEVPQHTDEAAPAKPHHAVWSMVGDALNDGANAHHALEATLEGMRDQVYASCNAQAQGMFEAALASVAQLDRAMGRGLDAWGAR